MPLARSILHAATEVVATAGHPELSMRRVARAVGVSPMALYRHYRDREDLLDAVAEAGFRELEAALWRIDRTSAPGDRILAVLAAYEGFSRERARLFELMFLTRRGRIRRFPEDFEEGRSRSFHHLREDVRSCMRRGELRAGDELETTLTLWAHAHGLIALRCAGRFGPDEERFRQLYLRSVRRVFEGLAPPA